MTVFTMVTEAFKAKALPSSVVQQTWPAVEKEVAADEMMVPTMVPPKPPAALMVAELPTCQKTFLGCAPPARMTLRGAVTPGPPTVRVLAIWKTQTAFGLPWASRVRSAPPWIRN